MTQRTSLHFRILMPLLVAFVIVGSVGAAYVARTVHGLLAERYRLRVTSMARTLAGTASATRDPSELSALAKRLASLPEVRFVVVVEGSPARVVAANEPEWVGSPLSAVPVPRLPDRLATALASVEGPEARFVGTEPLDAAMRFHRLLPGGGRVDGVVLISQEAESLRAAIRSTVLGLALQGVLWLGLMTGVSVWVIRRNVLVPVDRMMADLNATRPAEGSRVVHEPPDDQLGGLARALNGAMQRLVESDSRGRRLVEELRVRNQLIDGHSGITEADESGRILYANQRFCEMSGYRVEDLLGNNHRMLRSGRHGAEFWDAVYRALTQDGVWRGEVCNRRPDGTEYWISTTKVAVRDGAGRVARYIAVSNDITDRVNAVHVAERAQRLLEVFIEHAPAAVAMFDRDMRYVSHSRKWLSDYGLGGRDLRGLSHYEVFPETPDVWREVHRRCLAGAVERCDADPFVRASGQVQWLRWEVRPWPDADGSIGGVVMCTVDITESRRQADDLERAKAQAEAAARAKADFLAVMSHELRTPMNGVLGFANLLADTPLDAEQRSYVQTIRQSGDALLALLNDLLDFSKAESGRMTLETGVTSPREAAEDVVELLVPRACEAGLEVVLLADAEPPAVVADPARLRQVLTNLLGNAIKFTQKGEICVKIETAGNASQHQVARFSVTDTGIGIPEDVLPELFTRFRQADASISRRYGGTGLGLAISKQLVEAMGGEIGVTSQPRLGSTFWFTVPCAKDGTLPTPEDRPDPLPVLPSSLRVLAIVDRERPRELLRRLLEDAGVRSDVRAPEVGPDAGLEALVGSGGSAWDVLILDLMHPSSGVARTVAALREAGSRRGPGLLVFECPNRRGAGGLSSRDGRDAIVRPLIRVREFFSRLADVAQRVPRHPVRTAAPAARGSGVLGLGHRRVLVAEDNAVNQLITRSLVERLGHRVDVAGNGLEAVEMIRQIEYDLVLMDCQMPEMDGFEATRAIRRWEEGHGRTRRMPIVGVTASAVPEVEAQCRECGMDSLLRKPLREAELSGELRRFMKDG